MKRIIKKVITNVVCLLLLFSVVVLAEDDYPERLKNGYINQYTDYGFYSRQCTSFLAWRINSRYGIPFHNRYKGVLWGHAKDWANAARAVGVTVNGTPAVGAIAQNEAGDFGHVAWVSAVNGDYITIEEYNWYIPATGQTDGLYHTRTMHKSSFPNYIHFGGAPDSGNQNSASEVEIVNRYYKRSEYDEGNYQGEWRNGAPNGFGKITYDDFEDGRYYSCQNLAGVVGKGLYYEGNFVDGRKNGLGKLVYDNGCKEVGRYFGAWAAGKKVFEGRVYYEDGSYNEGYLQANSPIEATWYTATVSGIDFSKEDSETVSKKKEEYTISYDANGGENAPDKQIKIQDEPMNLRYETPNREGYQFIGWATTSFADSATYYPGDSYQNNGHLSLFAVWKVKGKPIIINNPMLKQQNINLNLALDRSKFSDWAQQSIERAHNLNIVPDFAYNDFKKPSTRMDFVHIAYNLLNTRYPDIQGLLYEKKLIRNITERPVLKFKDLDFQADSKNAYMVSVFNAFGIIKGVSEDQFSPDTLLNREQAAVILNNLYLFLKWGEVVPFSYENTLQSMYKDNQQISSWARMSVYNLKFLNVMQGTNTGDFNPKEEYTLEQSITTIIRLLDTLEK